MDWGAFFPPGWVIYWDYWIEFVKAASWPVAAIATVVVFGKPLVRLINAFAEQIEKFGGSVSVMGVEVATLTKKLEKIKEDVASEPEGASVVGSGEPTETNPLGEAGDPYTTVMNGWGRVVQALEAALERSGIERMDRRNPMAAADRLKGERLIGEKIYSRIKPLYDLRNLVKRAGSAGLGQLGIDQERADDYYATSVKVARSIANAISSRDSSRSARSIPLQPDADQAAMSQGSSSIN